MSTGRTRGLHVVDRPPLDPPGAGAPSRVVVVHGAMDRGTSFARVGMRLREVEYVTYDRRGYAASSGVGVGATFDEQVEDLLDVVDGTPSVLAGHSFGGAVVLAVAARRPELVRAAAVFEPPAPWEPWWPGTTLRAFEGRDPADAAEAFMRRTVGDRVWERLPSATREQRRAEGATLRADLEALAVARPFDPATFPVPLVVGWGTASPDHLRRSSAELLTGIAGAVGVEVDGSGHGVHLTHPDALAAIIRRAVALGDGAGGGTAGGAGGRPASG